MSTTSLRWPMKAPRQVVYRALVDGPSVEKWMVPDGMRSHLHAFDARVGGAFRISLTYDGPTGAGKTTAHTDTYHGHFVELVPNARVVQRIEFETADPAMQGEMTVTFTLTDVGADCELVAVHENVPPGVSPEDNALGWRLSLGKLAALVQAEAGERER